MNSLLIFENLMDRRSIVNNGHILPPVSIEMGVQIRKRDTH